MKKYTPGPWCKDHTGNHNFIRTEDGRTYICEFERDAKGSNETIEMHEKRLRWQVANAQLIAAAPELLEACKAVLAFLDKVGCDGDLYDQVENAVAKVEGRYTADEEL